MQTVYQIKQISNHNQLLAMQSAGAHNQDDFTKKRYHPVFTLQTTQTSDL